MSHFAEWKEHVKADVVQIKAEEISVKTLQQELMLTNSSTKHNDELGMIFNSFSDFKSSLQKSIHTVTESVDRIEDSTLVVSTIDTSINENLILERNI